MSDLNVDLGNFVESLTKTKKAQFLSVLFVGAIIVIFSIIYANEELSVVGRVLILYSLAANLIRQVFKNIIANFIIKTKNGSLCWGIIYYVIQLVLFGLLIYFVFPLAF